MRALGLTAVSALLTLVALSGAARGDADHGADALADAARRLAALPGFRAKVSAHDEVGGRSFEATLVYRAPDRLFARIPPEDFVLADGGAVLVHEGGVTRRSEVAAWVGETCAALAPIFAEGTALAGPDGGAPPRFADAARTLGLLLALDLRERGDRTSIALNVVHRPDLLAPGGAPGIAFSFALDEPAPPIVTGLDAERIEVRAGPREATILRATGLPEHVLLRSPTGRKEAEVFFREIEVLPQVPDELLAPPPPATTEASTAAAPPKIETVGPPPWTKERLARGALRELLSRLRAGAARDPQLVARERPRIESVLERYYAALFRAAYPETKLREEARRAADADRATVEAALARAGAGGRAKALGELREVFRANCATHMRDAAAELIHLAEDAIGGADAAAGPAAEEARRALVGISGGAVLAAFRETIVAPMEAEAGSALEKLASENHGDRGAAATPAPATPLAGGKP
jgi:hypothetical protein